MRMKPALRIIFILAITGMIVYELIDGIRYQSIWGIGMALASLLAMLYVIRLYRKLAQLQKEEEDQEITV